MIKYSIREDLARLLIEHGLCQTEEEAVEKVASGEAVAMLKTAGVYTEEKGREE